VRLLGRGDKGSTPGRDPVSALLDCFGIETPAGRDPPSAPYCRLGDAPQAVSDSGFVLHADPVHLRPDRDRLLLFDAAHLGLTSSESSALVDLFNHHFAEDGLRLETASAERWYLRLEDAPAIRTTPLHAAVGRGIGGLLPAGRDAGAWVRMLNEIQMLFHHAETNRVREREGRPTVSGIWPWGGGTLPARRPESDFDAVYATDSLALGLAVAGKIPAQAVPGDAVDLMGLDGQRLSLVYWDRLWRPVLDANGADWIEELGHLESWLQPLVRDGKRFRGLRLRIHPCNGEVYETGAGAMRRFWRGALRLSDRVSGGAGPGAERAP
jgi:hypothetical protein